MGKLLLICCINVKFKKGVVSDVLYKVGSFIGKDIINSTIFNHKKVACVHAVTAFAFTRGGF